MKPFAPKYVNGTNTTGGPVNLPLTFGMYAVGDLQRIEKVFDTRAPALSALTRDYSYSRIAHDHNVLYELEQMEWVPKIWIPVPKCDGCHGDFENRYRVRVITQAKKNFCSIWACDECYELHYAPKAPDPLVPSVANHPDDFVIVPNYTFYKRKS